MKQDELNAIAKRFFACVEARKSDLAEDTRELDTARYTDPARAEREKARLFREQPQIVGMSCDLREPGSFFTSRVADVPIIVTRTKSGALRAFVNKLQERGWVHGDFHHENGDVPFVVETLDGLTVGNLGF